jgi:hypothetical protein
VALSTTTKHWLYGVGSAFSGAVGSAISTIAIDPQQFNLTTLKGFGHVCIGAFISGVIAVGTYLKQRPLPPVDYMLTQQQAAADGTTTTTVVAQSTTPTKE